MGLVVGALCGCWIALFVTAVLPHAPYAAGGYTEEALVELPPGAIWLVVGGGALAGLAIAAVAGHRALPAPVKPVALGALVGVAVTVALTLVTSLALSDRPARSLADAIMEWGLAIGVPCGLRAGGASGWAAWKAKKR
jgi:hypothetical protein